MAETYWTCPRCEHSVLDPLTTCDRCGQVKGQPGPVKPALPTNAASVGASRVIVTDFDMPFGSMVSFIFKWALASIPAFLLLGIMGGILFTVLSVMLASAYR